MLKLKHTTGPMSTNTVRLQQSIIATTREPNHPGMMSSTSEATHIPTLRDQNLKNLNPKTQTERPETFGP